MEPTRCGIFARWSLLLLCTQVLGGSRCGGETDLPLPPEDEALTSMEEALVGKWGRAHAYDNSVFYYSFKSDRTACYWERSSSGSRTNEKSYSRWELNESSPVAPNVFKIVLRSSSGGTVDIDEFHYTSDEIWKGGYDNLRMFPATTSDDC